jgi:hypothetical protein
MNFSKLFRTTFVAIVAVSFSSCVKKDFDSPPSANADPDITANRTIAQIKTLADPGGAILRINDNLIISGVINSDDRSGNIYKTIIFQDETGGISISVDLNNYYAILPVGRRIFVKCQGLYIAKVSGVVQLGVLDDSGTQPALGRVPQGLVDTYIVRGAWGLTVTPKAVQLTNIATYNPAYENMLITMSNVEFTPSDTAKVYANSLLQTSLARYLEDCNHTSTLEVYTSGYATFANTLTPKGSGSVTGVYMAYNSTPELIVRDLDDVSMAAPRLIGGSPVGTGTLMSVQAVRTLYPTCGGAFAAGTKIRGVVISDRANANIDPKNLVLQNGNSGIVVRFTATHSFNLNDSLEINIGGDSLVSFSGLLEVNYATTAQATTLGTGSITPLVLTTAQVNSGLASYESTLVKIASATISGSGAAYSGSLNITDAAGTLILYTRSGATFATTNYPASVVSITGYVNNFNGLAELNIRSSTDVQ